MGRSFRHHLFQDQALAFSSSQLDQGSAVGVPPQALAKAGSFSFCAIALSMSLVFVPQVSTQCLLVDCTAPVAAGVTALGSASFYLQN